MSDPAGEPAGRTGQLRITAEELAGDLPPVCARTGEAGAAPTPVFFLRSPWWAWTPLAVVLGAAVVGTSWAPLASWWLLVALAVIAVASRGATGQVPLSASQRGRIANLRRRRRASTMAGLLLTWVAVALWLLGSRAGGILVLAAVLACYAASIAMSALARALGVGGRPTAEGGAVLTRVHPDFATAVALHRTGHRP